MISLLWVNNWLVFRGLFETGDDALVALGPLILLLALLRTVWYVLMSELPFIHGSIFWGSFGRITHAMTQGSWGDVYCSRVDDLDIRICPFEGGSTGFRMARDMYGTWWCTYGTSWLTLLILKIVSSRRCFDYRRVPSWSEPNKPAITWCPRVYFYRSVQSAQHWWCYRAVTKCFTLTFVKFRLPVPTCRAGITIKVSAI